MASVVGDRNHPRRRRRSFTWEGETDVRDHPDSQRPGNRASYPEGDRLAAPLREGARPTLRACPHSTASAPPSRVRSGSAAWRPILAAEARVVALFVEAAAVAHPLRVLAAADAEFAMFNGTAALRDRREAFRSDVPICEFPTRYIECGCPPNGPCTPFARGEGCIVPQLHCPVCGSIEIEAEEWPDYGGTASGHTRCSFCGYTTTWADLSAVI